MSADKLPHNNFLTLMLVPASDQLKRSFDVRFWPRIHMIDARRG